MKTYPRCYYIPLNDDSKKNSTNFDIGKEDDNNIDKVNYPKEINETKKEGKTNNFDIKKLKHELKEFKSKEEKKKKSDSSNVITPTLSSSEKEESKNNIHYKQEYINNNKNKEMEMSEDSLNSSPNLHKMNKKHSNFESMDESNSDWSNYNFTSSNTTFKSKLNEEDVIQKKRELSKSLESLFDEENKNNPPISKENDMKKIAKEKKLEKISNYSDKSDNENESLINSFKNKISKPKKKYNLDSNNNSNENTEDDKNKFNQNLKKESNKNIEENIFKRKKLKKEKRMGKVEIDKMDEENSKKLEDDIKNMDDIEKERKLLQMKKRLHLDLLEKDIDKDQDSSFESRDKLKRIKSSSSLSSTFQFESLSFKKMAKKVIRKKKRGEELTESEIAIFNKIQKKKRLEKAENSENKKLQKTITKKDNRYISSYASKPCISAEEVITDYSIYEEFGNPDNKKIKQGKYDTIRLLYPNGKYESYPLIVPKKSDELSPIEDLKYTIKMVIRYCVPPKFQKLFGDTKNGIIRSIIKATNRKNKEGLKKAITEYNKTLEYIINEKAFVNSEEYGDVSPPELVSHILIQAYSRTVAQKSEMLNLYRGFSNNVYGEVNSNLVTEFIKNSELKPHHIFIDMGSGIGNVVLQVASQVLCESWGVEIMEIPSTFAKAQCIEFISRMRYYGKPCGKIKLRHADFLEDPEVDRILKVADVVFVNNYAFDAKLNQRILQKFLDLKENTRIISLKSFVSLDHRINYRNANSLESILRVEEYLFGHDSVSWTNEEGKYYIHRVDRSILQSFEKNMKANRIH
ncbi:DOT1-domain-containing protein [Neocallimastix lanati (nom. inval.)]|jgi:hypothetical protein|uniref:Histone-lysine N-methyltransferase, H3 lysine-79 specific n=1 Tax=Neocallimastix californiae TaxID=1754190 RepID=A0A1Y2CW40_9FUNG|nr:DOT1-domain-containing protein [Neocallimastix sp. JGI-2020a]ORY51197.1 DOT1-domain-containing protein [Neocallimastix californiae]|eukprot:ORY51197.1 DOT1-domain-containing protein [Neocallimastix californiae]